MPKDVILITTGDPEGIGPEVVKKALKDQLIKNLADFHIIKAEDGTGFDALQKAAQILKQGRARGLVTAPVNKYKINKQGVKFTGHTEYLAESTRAKQFAMMFWSRELKVTLVTRHIPLKKVSAAISKEKIKQAICLTQYALKKYFNIKKPRIGVCGLNPHAGENALIGTEEKEIITPLLKEFPWILGPLPADTAFYMAYRRKLDAVITMYHDQGLAPFKMIAFDKGVNITLGLPFVRTSPDHGTAYDIAGKGIANPASMKEAIKLAVKICKNEGV